MHYDHVARDCHVIDVRAVCGTLCIGKVRGNFRTSRI